MKFLTAVITLWLVIHHLHAQNNTQQDPVGRQPSDSSAITSMKGEVGNTEDMVALKSIFDRYNMDGTIIIFDPSSGKYAGYNSARWDSGYLPASTFKIPNTLIGLESAVIDTGYIFRWMGEKRRFPQWEKDLNLQEAFQVSCVPCYQELAKKIGVERMVFNLKKINYPGMDVHPENIDLFWLEGKSRITPRQQLDFIRRLYEESLPVKTSVMKTLKAIMINEKTSGYTLSGKTGWAVRNGNNYGWFVGWIDTKGGMYYLATLVEPKNQEEVTDFALARKTVTLDVLRFYRFIP